MSNKWSSIGLPGTLKTSTPIMPPSSGGTTVAQSVSSIHEFRLRCAYAGVLQGRLNMEQTADLIGCKTHHIPILIEAGLIKPLGNASRGREKWFPSARVVLLAQNEEFLEAVTNAIYEHSENSNAARKEQ
jgi:hypothetical protein